MIAIVVLAAAVAALLVLLELRDRRWHSERDRLDRAHRAELEVLRAELLDQVRAHAAELASAHDALAKLAESHRQEMAALNQARCEEVSNLCQRIQAPQFATAAYDAAGAEPDQPAVNLDDDEDYWAAATERMDQLHRDLEAAGAPGPA